MTEIRPDTRDPLAMPHGDVVPEHKAKQGHRGFHVLAILVVSLALVVAAFSALGLFHGHRASDSTPAAAAARTAGTPTGG
jgi:hypothetical protein